MPTKRRLAIWAGIILIGLVATVVDLLVIYPSRPGPGEGTPRQVEVPGGIGPKGLAKALFDAGIISSPGRFALWLRAVGKLSEVKAGIFLIADNATPVDVLEALSGRGIERGVKVTIPEGFTLTQIGTALKSAELVEKKAFISAAIDSSIISALGIPGPTAEGYLFPDTYFFEESREADYFLKTMHDNFKGRLASIGFSKSRDLKQMVTLASIVQAEARVADEMPIIAGVYTNRLTLKEFPSRLLQADPTVSYGCESFVKPRAKSCGTFKGVLARRQLDDSENPYNTYRHQGLPPGPICAPGLDALKAATTPAKVPYLYFVVKNGGRHAFSKTLKEHQQAVKNYRRGR
ncbi:MAG: endolytic transglycosylase MltG [Deltaproteobacteria bacterium]|nr:endolytic transglycosylase MltG [Deltaproteobacteria bacterium]